MLRKVTFALLRDCRRLLHLIVSIRNIICHQRDLMANTTTQLTEIEAVFISFTIVTNSIPAI